MKQKTFLQSIADDFRDKTVTERTLNNIANGVVAFSVVNELCQQEKYFKYYCKGDINGEKDFRKKTVVSELGRLYRVLSLGGIPEDIVKEQVKKVAIFLADQNYPTSRAILYLRNVRNKRGKRGDIVTGTVNKVFNLLNKQELSQEEFNQVLKLLIENFSNYLNE